MRQPAPEKKAGHNLLARPSPEQLAALEQALVATARAFPMSAAHRKDLPLAIRDLSQMLTLERAELSRSYWSAPRYLAAYLHYFLPWNLYRLSWLLPGLSLNIPPDARLLDLGSGPLTLPLALWCARPDLRALPLHFTCSDVSLAPMEKGRAILKELTGANSPWRISLLRAPVEKALRAPADSPWHCITAGNALNELCMRRQSGEEHLAARLEKLMAQAASCLAPEGRLLLVEPGARLGGKLIALARKGALSQGLHPLAPCTHAADCPMAGDIDEPQEGEFSRRPLYSGWCHFIHPASDAPASLQELSHKARLEKRSLALSCLLMTKPAIRQAAQEGEGKSAPRAAKSPLDELGELEALFQEIMQEDAGVRPQEQPFHQAIVVNNQEGSAEGLVRIISSPITLPARGAVKEETARYACCEKGLALVLDALRLPSGSAVRLSWPLKEERDHKTGALLLNRNTEPATGRPPVPREKAKHVGKAAPGKKHLSPKAGKESRRSEKSPGSAPRVKKKA